MFDPSPRMGRSCYTKLRCPTGATKSIFHVGMQVTMRKNELLSYFAREVL